MRKYLFFLLTITILFSCKKEIMDTDQSATLHFSNDTIIFDTAFHSIGTPTQTLTIYNRNNFAVLTNISLNLVNEGSFRMNVDGVPGINYSAIEIPAKDSIFIFLEVTPNNNNNNDFLLTSKIEFVTGPINNETSRESVVEIVCPAVNINAVFLWKMVVVSKAGGYGSRVNVKLAWESYNLDGNTSESQLSVNLCK